MAIMTVFIHKRNYLPSESNLLSLHLHHGNCMQASLPKHYLYFLDHHNNLHISIKIKKKCLYLITMLIQLHLANFKFKIKFSFTSNSLL